MGLRKKYSFVTEPAHDWISSMGRSKYLTPVYQALWDSGQHELALTWNDENKDFYHPVAESAIMKIIGDEQRAPAQIQSSPDLMFLN